MRSLNPHSLGRRTSQAFSHARFGATSSSKGKLKAASQSQVSMRLTPTCVFVLISQGGEAAKSAVRKRDDFSVNAVSNGVGASTDRSLDSAVCVCVCRFSHCHFSQHEPSFPGGRKRAAARSALRARECLRLKVHVRLGGACPRGLLLLLLLSLCVIPLMETADYLFQAVKGASHVDEPHEEI